MSDEALIATKYVGFEPEIEFLAKLVSLFEETPMDDGLRDRAMRYLIDRYLPRDGTWAYAPGTHGGIVLPEAR